MEEEGSLVFGESGGRLAILLFPQDGTFLLLTPFLTSSTGGTRREYHGNLVPSVRRLAVGAVEASEKDGMRVCRTDEPTEPNPGSKNSPSWRMVSTRRR